MNNSRRKRINQSIAQLESAKAMLEEVLEKERNALSTLPDDEEYDDMRDGMDDVTSSIENTISSLDDALDNLNSCDF